MNELLKLLSSLLSSTKKTSTQPKRVERVDLIKKHEALRLEAYLPTPHDVWTIGYGHTKNVHEGMHITDQEAERLLRWDIEWVEDTLNEVVKVPLTQKQYDALASLVFNIGAGAFRKSTVLRRLNNKDYEGAADAFLMWNKQRQNGKLKVLRGLTKRRTEEMELFLDGTS